MRTLYIDSTYFSGLSESCCVIAVSPLQKELILYAVNMPRLYQLIGPEESLLTVLMDQIQDMSITPFELPIPEDSRLKKIYKRFSNTPGDNRTLEDWGKRWVRTGGH
jgi:hypothetical protein